MGGVRVETEALDSVLALEAVLGDLPVLYADFSDSDSTSFTYSFYWKDVDLGYEDVESLLEEDDSVELKEEEVFMTSTNKVANEGEIVGIRFNPGKYRILADQIPAEMLMKHYAETVGSTEGEARELVEAVERELEKYS